MLTEFSIAYRSTPHTTTGMTPFTLMFGHEMRTKLPMLSGEIKSNVDEARDCDLHYKQKIEDYVDRGAKEHSISEGDTDTAVTRSYAQVSYEL